MEPSERTSRQVSAGVYLLSKLSQLKQDAYQAGKKRDWVQAVSIYERILEVDKNNPTVINELGDLCLKSGETSRAVKYFLNAAAKYRQTGLLNNAVAIYKKILRYEADNNNAHWYLAETRASQGLMVEGEEHGIRFLESSEKVSGDIKEIFLKRCVQLFELYHGSNRILENLLQIFRMWNMPLEAARTRCLLACQLWESGEQETATQAIGEIQQNTPEIANYPEFARWTACLNPDAGTASAAPVDFNSVALDDSPESAAAVPETSDAAATPPESVPAAVEVDSEPAIAPALPPTDNPAASADETSFGDLSLDGEAAAAVPADDVEPPTAENAPEPPPHDPEPVTPEKEIEEEKDDDGCFSIDLGGESSLDDLISQAASGLQDAEPSEEMLHDPAEKSNESSESPAVADSEGSAEAHESVDLLAQILAEDGDDLGGSDSDQLATITQEIGAQVGGDSDESDPASLYEMGMVYLEMGLYDQSCASFEKAAADPEYAVRARETWGVALLRAERAPEAIEVLNKALELPEEGSREQLGLLYHLARAHEDSGTGDEALALYERIHAMDRTYLDVGRRLAALSTA